MVQVLRATALLLAAAWRPAAAGSVALTRDNWHSRTQGQAWFVKFYQQGAPTLALRMRSSDTHNP